MRLSSATSSSSETPDGAEPVDTFRSGWKLVGDLLEGSKSEPLASAIQLSNPTIRAICHHIGFVDEAARRESVKAKPPHGRSMRGSAATKMASVVVQLSNQCTVSGQVWPALLGFLVAQHGASSRAIWRSTQALLHSSAVTAENILDGVPLADSGLLTDASGVFAPRHAALQEAFAKMPPHTGDPDPGLYEQADATGPPPLLAKDDLALTSTLWQAEHEASHLREAVLSSLPAGGVTHLLGSTCADPSQVAEFLLGMCEACVTAAAMATTPGGAEAGSTAQVPPGAVAALLRLQVAAGHGARAENSLARAHEAKMLLQMRHYEPVLRLRATRRHLRETIALLQAMQERGVTSNSDVSDEAYGLVLRCVLLCLEEGLRVGKGAGEGGVTHQGGEGGRASLQEALEAIAQSVDATGAVVLSPSEAEQVALAVLHDASKEVSHPGKVLLAEVEALFAHEAMQARGWRLARSIISHDGRCPASGSDLERRQLRGKHLFEAAALLRQMIVEHETAQRTKLANQRGRRQSQDVHQQHQQHQNHHQQRSILSGLDAHIVRNGPFDMVIDGANLGLFRRSASGGYLSYNQLDVIVQHATACGLNPLVVLHRRWMRPDDLVPDAGKSSEPRGELDEARAAGKREMVQVVGRWRRDNPGCHFVIPRGNDDIYWMYAAMQSQRLKLRAAALGRALNKEEKQTIVDEVFTVQHSSAVQADEAAAAAAVAKDTEAARDGPLPLQEALALDTTVWLVTNDQMRDHKGELLGWRDFAAWRSAVVKALPSRSPRWYARGSEAFDEAVDGLRSGHLVPGSGEKREERRQEAINAASMVKAAEAFLSRAQERRQGKQEGGAFGLSGASAGMLRDESSLASLASVRKPQEIKPEHGSFALDQLRRTLHLVLPHSFLLRFHASPQGKPTFFFPGFDKHVDSVAGVPIPKPAPASQRKRQRKAGAASVPNPFHVDAEFENIVRASPWQGLWQVMSSGEGEGEGEGAGEGGEGEPARAKSALLGRAQDASHRAWKSEAAELPTDLRWSEDRPEHPDCRLVLPAPQHWFVLFKDQDERA